MQQRVYERHMNNVDELKQRLIAVWDGMQQNVINSAVDERRKRLRASVCADCRGSTVRTLFMIFYWIERTLV